MGRTRGQAALDRLEADWQGQTFSDWELPSLTERASKDPNAEGDSLAESMFGNSSLSSGGRGNARIGGAASGVIRAAAGAIPGGRLALSVISSLIGNPRTNYARKVQERLVADHFAAPTRRSVNSDAGGMTVDHNWRGQLRSSGTGAFLNSGTSGQYGNGALYQPGRAGQSFDGTSSNPVSITIQAMDAKSVMDRSSDIADALRSQLQSGHPVAQDIRQAVQLG